jgi:rhodanese-related sulfurtransferase
MMKRINPIYFLLVALLLSACSGGEQVATAPQSGAPAAGVGKPVSVPGGTYTDVSVAELQTMLENKDFTFVNVHIPFEGNIPATDLSVPYDEIEDHLDELPADKDAKIVLYCRSDRMSRIAAEKLVPLGYTNLYNLDGGFVEWENAGLPIEK